MSEKITHTLVAADLLEWSVYSPTVKTELYSHALVSDEKVVLVDPVLPDAATLTAINKLGTPGVILLTSGNHERSAREVAKFLHIPVASPALAVKEFGFKPDIIVDDLKQIYGINPVSLSGAGIGEHGYYCPQSRILVLGDAILNLPDGPVVLPDKYCTDSKQLKTSLTKLLSLDISILAFAHGKAIKNPAAQLKTLLAA
ncbi:MAG: hypothetical protein LBH01_02550 [Verrucomicrobiales bacterium]|jgi:glyoxylase-like metal-dependent hydrolase (beta-lactamase superfamily II)|nr:hypothetical protein [Verrucomicrobiales bacterium]